MATTIVLNPLGSEEIWNVSTEQWNTSNDLFFGEAQAPRANATANSMDGIFYAFTGIPELIVSRSNVQALISIANTIKYDIRLYRAEDHRALFYQYVDQVPTASAYSDNGVWQTYTQTWDDTEVSFDQLSESLNYKYKASFIAIGTKNGVAYELESQTSPPVYTIGDRTL